MVSYIDNLLILKIIVLNNYLEKDSLFNLLNISHDIYYFKKYLIKKITLKNSDALKFYNDENFQKRILNLANNDKDKINLKFNKKYSEIINNLNILELSKLYKCNLDFSFSNINNVSSLIHVHTLKLIGCKLIKDVSELCNLYELDLSYCDNIDDFSNLGNIHILILHKCKLRDISNLSNVIDVKLLYVSLNIPICLVPAHPI
jgi:hypothetical protein